QIPCAAGVQPRLPALQILRMRCHPKRKTPTSRRGFLSSTSQLTSRARMTLPVVTYVGAAARIIGPEATHAVLHAAATTALLVVAGLDFVRGGRVKRAAAIVVRATVVAAAIIVRRRERAADDRAGGETATEPPAPTSAAPLHILDIARGCILDRQRAANRHRRSDTRKRRHRNRDQRGGHQFRDCIRHCYTFELSLLHCLSYHTRVSCTPARL